MFNPAPRPEGESERLAALREYQLLDTPAEELFDCFTRLAAQVCAVPISTIGLIDRDREFFKAKTGLEDVVETRREVSFGAHAMLDGRILEVEDATSDARFRTNPLVVAGPTVRFCAGVALTTRTGRALGALCVFDRTPRVLSADQRTSLHAIAAAIVEQFEARRAGLRRSAAANERMDLLAAAMDAAQDAIFIATPGVTAEDPSRIVYANEAFLRQKGATFDEVIGQPVSRFSGPRTEPAKLAEMRDKLVAGQHARVEYVTYRMDGSHYHCEVAAKPLVDEDGATTHFVLVARDVTDAVLRGMTLELQNERLTALTSIARGLFASLEPRALVESLVGGVHELTGGTARLLAARADGSFVETSDLTVRADAADVADDFIRGAADSDVSIVEDPGRRAAVRILGPSGGIAYVLDLHSGSDGFATADIFTFGLLGQYLAVAVRNVELYNELTTRRAAVIELNQIKNDLIAMLAHDFKGPLTTIVGFADALAEDDRFDAESRQFLGMISSTALRLASLATDTLAFSRLEQNELTLHPVPVDLVALLRDITRVFSVTRAIDVRAQAGELTVTGDASRLRQVFENLIGNAIKYSPGGETVEVGLRAKRGGVDVTIRDRGIGIPQSDLSKLFGRFARGTNARELGIGGTGFGLYLAKTIVELHGGRINVESKQGSGSTFRVFIPTTPAPRAATNRRMLLLDAEGDSRSYVAHTLRDDGYAVDVVMDDAELVGALDDELYDVAIVDVERLSSPAEAFIAKVGGRTALVRLGSTGSDRLDPWDAVLRKPFLIKDLQKAVESAIAQHSARSDHVASGDASKPASSAAGSR